MRKVNYICFSNTEIILVISSISSSVASIIFQQAAFAAMGSIPLSLAVSFSSYNRKQLDKLTQQHQVSITQLSNNREFLNDFLSSLPNHSELANTESRLAARHTDFAKQLDSLKEQICVYSELQQKVADVQQRLLTMESSIQTSNYKLLYAELQNPIASLEEKNKKLEQQFNNLPIFELQYRTTQVEQSVSNLQVSFTETTQICNLLLEENQLISQQFQALSSKTETLSSLDTEVKNQQLLADLHTSFKNSTELNQNLVKEFDSLRQQVKAISSSSSKEITALRVEPQRQLSYVEKSERKLYVNIHELDNRCKKLENKVLQSIKEVHSATSTIQINQKQRNEKIVLKEVKYMCEHCNSSHKNQPIKGGYFLQSNFYGHNCKQEYERMNGLL